MRFRTAERRIVSLASSLFVMGAALVADAETSPSDEWITAATRMALVRAQAVEGRAIGTDTEDGVILLHGMVGSQAEKTRALAITRRIPGVEGIRDALSVVPWEEQREIALSDALVAGRVAMALSYEEALFGSPIEVHAVGDGIAVLSGEVSEPDLHRRAIEVTAGVDGVRRVVSLVRSPDARADARLWDETAPAVAVEEPSGFRAALSDAWIQSRLKWRLLMEPGLSPTDVDIDTQQGIVTLFGIVSSPEAKLAAQQRALAVDGVLFVQNDLQVVPPSVAETVASVDADLEREVEQRIEGQQLEEADISVDVRNATVRLKGTVESDHDRMKAILVAAATRGVRGVSDGLEVAGRG